MAAVRGFSLEKLASVRMIFSVFDNRSTSTRCVCVCVDLFSLTRKFARSGCLHTHTHAHTHTHTHAHTHTHTHEPTPTIREFMRRVTAARVRETNSKCDVTHEVRGDQTPPTVQVKFSTSYVTMLCVYNVMFLPLLSLLLLIAFVVS